MQSRHSNWFVVYTKPRQERVALEHLQRQGFTCYLPEAINPYQRRRKIVGAASAAKAPQKGNRNQLASEPLFPRYLFLNTAPGQQSLAPVRSTRGVANLVRFGTRLAEVHETVIQAIKNRQDPRTGLVTLDAVPAKPGDDVKVFDGPLAGLRGIFHERRGQNRALLLMSLLGTTTTVEVDALLLQKVG